VQHDTFCCACGYVRFMRMRRVMSLL